MWTFTNLLLLMAGGCVGAVARFAVGELSKSIWGVSFPYGTLIVNLAGCLLIGFLFGLGERTELMTPQIRLLLITGFLGALTTFSSYALESVLLGGSGAYLSAVLNFFLNNVGGFALVVLGLQCARLLTR